MAQSNGFKYKGDVRAGDWDLEDELAFLLYDHVVLEEAIRVGLDRGIEGKAPKAQT